MLVLDTNVVSAMMQPETHTAVMAWLDGQRSDSIWITSITIYEVRYGLGVMPSGRRQRALQSDFSRLLHRGLVDRVLDFDASAADSAARLAADYRRRGEGFEVRDLLIAGIVASRGATLATRNVRHFAASGVALVDPWGRGISDAGPG